MKKMLLLEDDPFHLEFLVQTLSETALDAQAMLCFDSGEKAIDAIEREEVSCAVLDLQLPSKSGIDVAKAIWNLDPTIPVVFWSNYGDASYVRALVKIVPEGTNFGYILKTTSAERLKRALLGVLIDGQRIIDSEVRGLLKRSDTKFSELSETEYETLNLLALGLTDKAIARIQNISLRSVQNQIQSVHEKIAEKAEELLEDGSLINRRCRTISNAIMVGLINAASLEEYQAVIRKKISMSVGQSLDD